MVSTNSRAIDKLVMLGLDPGIHVLAAAQRKRGWPGQARP
jgi:hypothetical protein